jgi:hypothetical protein
MVKLVDAFSFAKFMEPKIVTTGSLSNWKTQSVKNLIRTTNSNFQKQLSEQELG